MLDAGWTEFCARLDWSGERTVAVLVAMMENEQNLMTGLSEGALWRYLRLSLERVQCPFVTW